MLSIRSAQKNKLPDHPMSAELITAIARKVHAAELRNKELLCSQG